MPKTATLVAATLALAALAGCGHPVSSAASRPASVPATLQAAAKLDRAALIKASADVLAAAVDANDQATVDTFVAYADGQDADPAATRAIAGQAQGTSRARNAAVARIASGGAHPKLAAAQAGIRFPQDEAAHGNAITEWWYLNGHLDGANKASYGYEFTLFKIGPLLHWAHVAVTDAAGQTYSYDREWVSPGEAKASPEKLAVAFARQTLAGASTTGYQLGGQTADHRFSLQLAPKKQPLLIEGDGKIDMPEGAYSWYYSVTSLAAKGTMDGRPVEGISWLDHQWGPFWVTGLADRWDWFSVQADDATEYNLFGFRDAKGNAGARHVNESLPNGGGATSKAFTMTRKSWWQSPHTGAYFTTAWHIDVPASHEAFDIEATNKDQELWRTVGFLRDPLPNYWEGKMLGTKTTADGRQVPVRAYCEHFGFASPQGPS